MLDQLHNYVFHNFDQLIESGDLLQIIHKTTPQYYFSLRKAKRKVRRAFRKEKSNRDGIQFDSSEHLSETQVHTCMNRVVGHLTHRSYSL